MTIHLLAAAPFRRARSHLVQLSLLCMLGLLAACGNSSGEGASQVVASVDGDEVTESQVNGILQKQANLKPEQLDAASHRAVDALVQQDIVLRKARDLKLDREQQVVHDVEAAKRDIVAKAYMDRIADGAAKPTAKEIQAYYEANPVLFAERRVYTIQEVAVEVGEAQKKEIESQLTGLKTPGDFDAFLKARQIPYKTSRNTVAAENVPLPLLSRVAALKPGQGLIVAAPGGLRILMLVSAQDNPVTMAQATPAIGAFLWNQRKHTAVEQEMTALRAGSKVQFFGKYADLAASAAAASAPKGGASSASVGSTGTPSDAALRLAAGERK